MPLSLCFATTRSGSPCGFSARRETGLCVNHDPAYREQQRRNRQLGHKASIDARARTPHGLDPRDFDLSTQRGIQGLLDALFRLVMLNQVPDARAGQLLRILAMAERQLDNRPSGVPAIDIELLRSLMGGVAVGDEACDA